MRRYGNVCDTLVFCLVAVLLPAWLLGHLFLTFFPVSGSSGNVQTASVQAVDVSEIASSATGKGADSLNRDLPSDNEFDSKNTSTNGSEATKNALATSGSVATGTAPATDWQQRIEGMQNSLVSIKSQNVDLKNRESELKQANVSLETEVERLKSRLSEASTGSDNLALVKSKLTSLNEAHTRLSERFRETEQTKTSLESKLAQLQSQNQQLAARKQVVGDQENLRTKMETKVQDLTNQLRESESQLQTQLRLVQTMQAEESSKSEAAKLELTNQSQDLQNATEQRNVLRARVDELTGSLKAAQTKLAERESKLADLNKKVKTLDAKYNLTLKRLATASNSKPKKAVEKTRVAEKRSGTTTTQRPAELELSGPSDSPVVTREQYREYVSSRGNRSTLAFIQWVGEDQVIVRSFANKQLYQLPLGRFSGPDQNYLRTLKPKNTISQP